MNAFHNLAEIDSDERYSPYQEDFRYKMAGGMMSKLFAILNLLADGGKGVTEIARELDLTPSLVSRYMKQLEAEGYVVRNIDNRRFELGHKLIALGNAASNFGGLRQKTFSYMLELREKTCETIGLYVRYGNSRVCIDQVESSQPLRRVLPVGKASTLLPGAPGHVFCAYMSSAELSIHLSDYKGPIPDLERVCQQQYAVSLEERVKGGWSVAFPILDRHGGLVAVLSIRSVMIRYSDDKLKEFVKFGTMTAKQISHSLGYVENYSQHQSG